MIYIVSLYLVSSITLQTDGHGCRSHFTPQVTYLQNRLSRLQPQRWLPCNVSFEWWWGGRGWKERMFKQLHVPEAGSRYPVVTGKAHLSNENDTVWNVSTSYWVASTYVWWSVFLSVWACTAALVFVFICIFMCFDFDVWIYILTCVCIFLVWSKTEQFWIGMVQSGFGQVRWSVETTPLPKSIPDLMGYENT